MVIIAHSVHDRMSLDYLILASPRAKHCPQKFRVDFGTNFIVRTGVWKISESKDMLSIASFAKMGWDCTKRKFGR